MPCCYENRRKPTFPGSAKPSGNINPLGEQCVLSSGSAFSRGSFWFQVNSVRSLCPSGPPCHQQVAHSFLKATPNTGWASPFPGSESNFPRWKLCPEPREGLSAAPDDVSLRARAGLLPRPHPHSTKHRALLTATIQKNLTFAGDSISASTEPVYDVLTHPELHCVASLQLLCNQAVIQVLSSW